MCDNKKTLKTSLNNTQKFTIKTQDARDEYKDQRQAIVVEIIKLRNYLEIVNIAFLEISIKKSKVKDIDFKKKSKRFLEFSKSSTLIENIDPQYNN